MFKSRFGQGFVEEFELFGGINIESHRPIKVYTAYDDDYHVMNARRWGLQTAILHAINVKLHLHHISCSDT